ncbi:MAG: S-methyl-5-thioribose kinase, partial [Tissierellales bacterium]|nr:S-methyl-5-thioribose kinase [Tissierellales bacterium]
SDLLSENKLEYSRWLTKTIESTVDLFKVKFIKFLENNGDKKNMDFHKWYLSKVLEYSSGTAGLEIIRRIIGEAKVSDIETIENSDLKIKAERIGIALAKDYIMKRKNIKRGKDYLDIFDEKIKEVMGNETFR